MHGRGNGVEVSREAGQLRVGARAVEGYDVESCVSGVRRNSTLQSAIEKYQLKVSSIY